MNQGWKEEKCDNNTFPSMNLAIKDPNNQALVDHKVFNQRPVQHVKGQQVVNQQYHNSTISDDAIYHDFSQSSINSNGFSLDIRGRGRGFDCGRDRVQY